jgi:RNA polymerase sigma-70 factor (ECF subfamily)
VLQDSYLRWADVDLATVRDTKSYLAQLVTRQALKALRTSTRRREDYIGPWLPEPLLLDERAVFVLREVFGFEYDEIAGAVDKSVAAVRRSHTAPASMCTHGASDSNPPTLPRQRKSPSSS